MAAAVLRASRDAEGEAMAIDGVANGHVVHPLLVALKEILDVNGTREVPVSSPSLLACCARLAYCKLSRKNSLRVAGLL